MLEWPQVPEKMLGNNRSSIVLCLALFANRPRLLFSATGGRRRSRYAPRDAPARRPRWHAARPRRHPRPPSRLHGERPPLPCGTPRGEHRIEHEQPRSCRSCRGRSRRCGRPPLHHRPTSDRRPTRAAGREAARVDGRRRQQHRQRRRPRQELLPSAEGGRRRQQQRWRRRQQTAVARVEVAEGIHAERPAREEGQDGGLHAKIRTCKYH